MAWENPAQPRNKPPGIQPETQRHEQKAGFSLSPGLDGEIVRLRALFNAPHETFVYRQETLPMGGKGSVCPPVDCTTGNLSHLTRNFSRGRAGCLDTVDVSSNPHYGNHSQTPETAYHPPYN